MNDLIRENTGGMPSPKDERDFKLEIIASASLPEVLPQECFIDVAALPLWDQRKIGACVGHAWGKSQQRCELAETGKVIKLSARFLYAVAKARDGWDGEATFPRLVAKILKDYGCATEDTVPNDTTLEYDEYVYNRKIENIPIKAFQEALKYGIAGYAWADLTEEGIKKAIYYAKTKRQGIALLMRVGNTYWTAEDGEITWDPAKILPIRRPKDITSGHEIYPYGYEYKNGRFVIHFMNSWGTEWADGGKGWFYYDEQKDIINEVMTSIDKDDVPSQEFIKNLSFGMTDPDVMKLQKCLNTHGFVIATTGAGSPGKETNFFGTLTFNAVKKLQTAKAIPNTGFVGILTRQVLNAKE